jgi:translation initiation factor IF-3
MAEEQALDLVEISGKADPPVCKIIDYSKFKYEQKKKQKELKAKTQKVVLKEIRFGPNTDDHDFNFKVKHGHNFLQEGAKLKAYVQFVGRAIIFKERGEMLLLKFAQEMEEYGKVDQMPKLEGKRMILLMSPKPNAPKKVVKQTTEQENEVDSKVQKNTKNKAENEVESNIGNEPENEVESTVGNEPENEVESNVGNEPENEVENTSSQLEDNQ